MLSIQGQVGTQAQGVLRGNSSSSGGGGSEAVRAAWAEQAAISAAVAAAASQPDSSTVSVREYGALLAVQHMALLHNSPATHFQQAFSLAGQQQLTPLCLHPDLLASGSVSKHQPPASAGVAAAVELLFEGASQAARSAAAAAAAASPAAAERAFGRRMQQLRNDASDW